MKDKYISFPLSNKCLAITTTTELGNLAYQVDEGRRVKERRQLLADLLNVDYKRFVFVHQHHSDKIQKVTLNDLGKGTDSFESGVDVDALYTYEKNVPLCIFHADCVPIFFIDETKSLVGNVIANGSIAEMFMNFTGYNLDLSNLNVSNVTNMDNFLENVDVKHLKFYIGPYRMPSLFMIDDETRQKIVDAGLEDAIVNNRFDNGLASIIDLRRLGVKDEQITLSNLDTYSDDRFYSAYQKTPVGRLVSLIMLPYSAATGAFGAINITVTGISCLLVLGVLHTGIAYAMSFSSLYELRAQSAAMLSYIEPVAALLLSIFLLHEPFSAAQLAGAALIIGAAAAHEWLAQPAQENRRVST